MHLMIPHASALDDAARHAFGTLQLPHLRAHLARLTPAETWGGDAFSPHPPHHLAQAALRGQAAPSAAAWAVNEGAACAWARLTPVHLAVGTDGVDVLPPAALPLTADEAAQWQAVLEELWPVAEGWQWRALKDGHWALGHPGALDAPEFSAAASIERAAGRPIEPWLPQSRVLRRWQNEAQMLMHGHPLNAAREARGEHAINSVWMGDIGRAGRLMPDLVVDARLTAPMLNGDLAAWAEAWRQLDAGPLAQPLTSLTLCGERSAQRFTAQPLPWWTRLQRRWQAPEPAAVLEAL
ncbi:hypothetical protein [Roseateles sp. BYS87W]|uniref:Phosphoglycerate mutase n=1 Tax=Pelomonas baiyunensis TaxID=3299026 RepID=A0ABW7GUU5_9BURK